MQWGCDPPVLPQSLEVHGFLQVSLHYNLHIYLNFNLNYVLMNRKGLTYAETAYAVKTYKSHRRIPEAEEVREALRVLLK